MSDALQHHEDDLRAHRCLPPRPTRIGRQYTCSCGTTYQVIATKVGGKQWLPVTRFDR